MAEKIELIRARNWFAVSPTLPSFRGAVSAQLTFDTTTHYYGYEAQKRRDADLSRVSTESTQCFQLDIDQRIVTAIGFLPRVRKIIENAGYAVRVRWDSQDEADRYAEKLATAYKPDWGRIETIVANGFAFRGRQREALEVAVKYERGRISCPPGWGKGTIIALWGALFPRARIDVVAASVPVMLQRLYPEIAATLPSVGIIGGGRKITGKRVMCITAGSLHHGRFEGQDAADFVLVDEMHQAGAEKFTENLARYAYARIWGFSATFEKRLDNMDFRIEAMSGPVRLHVPYEEAANDAMIVPIEVTWTKVVMDVNPCSGIDDPSERKRAGVWSNEYRNGKIAKDARRYDDETQVLITVETIEHALYLKKLLPEFAMVYAVQSGSEHKLARDRKWYRKMDLIDDDFEFITREQLDQATREFTNGQLKRAIVTTVWNVGVDFKHLAVLIRGDAGGSPINDTQIPGRTSRINAGKTHGILHDYIDNFDEGFERRSKNRRKSYAENGWLQNEVGATRSFI